MCTSQDITKGELLNELELTQKGFPSLCTTATSVFYGFVQLILLVCFSVGNVRKNLLNLFPQDPPIHRTFKPNKLKD